MTRDEVLDAVYDEVTANDTCVEDSVVSLLEEIVRLREAFATVEAEREQAYAVAQQNEATARKLNAILTALREPSFDVRKAAWREEPDMEAMLQAAVAAAEKEVGA